MRSSACVKDSKGGERISGETNCIITRRQHGEDCAVVSVSKIVFAVDGRLDQVCHSRRPRWEGRGRERAHHTRVFPLRGRLRQTRPSSRAEKHRSATPTSCKAVTHAKLRCSKRDKFRIAYCYTKKRASCLCPARNSAILPPLATHSCAKECRVASHPTHSFAIVVPLGTDNNYGSRLHVRQGLRVIVAPNPMT